MGSREKLKKPHKTGGSPHFTPTRIALLALLTALGCVGRFAFALPILPNVQPMTTILLIIALHFGVLDGMIVTVLSILITNMLLGMGPWTLHQILTYLIIMVITGWMRPFYQELSKVNLGILAAYAGVTGLLYGFLISIFSVFAYQLPSFWAYYVRGLPFDLLHALGNVGFFLVLAPLLRSLLEKKIKIEVE